ncbi:MAG: hypothetical protein DMG78_19255 [Acidobacteria bacterium]|nr:MAG: hypothetical protein DMG78_19255 [Acidobacteriota bacterium]
MTRYFPGGSANESSECNEDFVGGSFCSWRTVKGYVLDSACAFTKGLKKPISADCATACAKAGSPLVILTDSGTIYWPIADTTPSSGQNDRLLPFAGQKVTATGKVFERGGSTALVIEKIEAQK